MGSWSFKAAPFLLLGNYERPLQHAKRTHTLQTPLISGEAVKALPRDPLTGLEPSCTRGEEGLEEQLRSTETTDSIHRRVSPVQEGEGGSHLDSSFRQPCSAREQRPCHQVPSPRFKSSPNCPSCWAGGWEPAGPWLLAPFSRCQKLRTH